VKHVVAYARRVPVPLVQRLPAAVTETQEAACRQVRARVTDRVLPCAHLCLVQLEQQLGLPQLPPSTASVEEAGNGASEWEVASPGSEPLFGEAALRLSAADDARRLRVWPLRRGRLNVTAEQPLSVVRAALEDVWRWAATATLGLAPAALRSLDAVLVLPAGLPSGETAELADVLLRALGVRSLVVHLESSGCAAAASAQLACVVTLGAVRPPHRRCTAAAPHR
jgi:hypothetical protein